MPCGRGGMNLFHDATMITMICGMVANFPHFHWLNGQKAKSIAPSIYLIATDTNAWVRSAHADYRWINNIATSIISTMQHLS